MRIISGILGSRVLKAPANDKHIRPTTDRARETLFNVLENRIDLKEYLCIDLFCGTGSVGIECISRNAGHTVFVDLNTTLLKKNIENLNLINKCTIIKSDSIKFLKLKRIPEKFNNLNLLIFADPPYDYKKYDLLLTAVSFYKCIFILEHSGQTFKDSEKIFLHKKSGITEFTFFNFKQII